MIKTMLGLRPATAAISLASLIYMLTGSAWADDGKKSPTQVRQIYNMRMPMRDGVSLSADAWLPEAPGRYPVVLIRSPYRYKTSLRTRPDELLAWTRHGYVVVVQDARGTGDSEGAFDFFPQEQLDGYDTIEWIARQPWSNGKLGMTGNSYMAVVQWAAARTAPPHLTCLFAAGTGEAGWGRPFIPYVNGVFSTGFNIRWAPGVSLVQSNGDRIHLGSPSELAKAGIDWDKVYRHRPILTMDEAAYGYVSPAYRTWLQHDKWDEYWAKIETTPEEYQKIDIPAFSVTGWFDSADGTLNFEGMRRNSPARDRQHILIGPWTHGENMTGSTTNAIGQIDRTGSAVDITALNVLWFDHCLKGTPAHFDYPRARVFITGLNVWQDLTDYPAPQAQKKKLFLHSGGQANTLDGDGRLRWEAPRSSQKPDRYTYDPDNPAPGPYPSHVNMGEDLRDVERRPDVLVYSSDVLTRPVVVLGNVKLVLQAASDARDTDWMARLLDVYPDGRALKLGQWPAGVIRARFRKGLHQEVFLTANEPEQYEISLQEFGHAFMPGHRIRLEITSSAYPYFGVNQNTGNPIATDVEAKIAHQTVFHDPGRLSYLVLPVMPSNERVKRR